MLGQSRGYEYLGRIIEIDENTNCLKMEIDPDEESFIKYTYLNLEAVVVYAIDEIQEGADLTEKEAKE